jgi:hypothetical protein
MVDSDRLATELSALRNTLRVRPPGVDAVVRTVARHRRRRIIGLMVTTFVALLAVLGAALGFAAASNRPDVTTSHSPAPTPSGSPSATPPASGRPSPSTGATGSAANPVLNGCRPNSPMGLLARDTYLADVDLMTYPDSLCPNERIEASWATYTVDAAGVQHLYRWQTVILDGATPTVTVSVMLPQACTYWVYFLRNAVIPATIAANANLVDSIPFRRRSSLAPSDIFSRFTGSDCESMTPVPPHQP